MVMHLDIVAASIILNKNGLQEPQLALLSADIVNYKTLLLQADGHIEITADGVKGAVSQLDLLGVRREAYQLTQEYVTERHAQESTKQKHSREAD
jgi:hypothetical protein